MTILRALLRLNYYRVKPTFKPGLTDRMRAARLAFALEHQNWTLDDWRRVIWTDETSVILGQRRGMKRVWRKPNEAVEKSCIRSRWPGYMEFMFWGCFCYDMKGPCHIWDKETDEEKKFADDFLAQMNAQREPECRQAWEAAQVLVDLHRNGKRRPGRAPQWRFTKATGKLVRVAGKGGIDWFRYLRSVVVPKLLPFIESCEAAGFRPIVQEDRAGPHAHKSQDIFYSALDIQRLIWPGNSPDMNMIEPCWLYMKAQTTKDGPPSTRAEAEERWLNAWNELSQETIQGWIKRIMHHIQEIIRLEGGNEYVKSTRYHEHLQKQHNND